MSKYLATALAMGAIAALAVRTTRLIMGFTAAAISV